MLGAFVLTFATGVVATPLGQSYLWPARPLAGVDPVDPQLDATAADGPSISYTGRFSESPAAQPAPASAISANLVRLSGAVGANLNRTLQAAGLSAAETEQYLGALAGVLRLNGDISVADRFDVIIERGSGVASGRLIYAGLDRIGRSDIELVRWTVDGKAQWMSAEGIFRTSSGGFRLPVNGRITSGFGTRFHPLLRFLRPHDGIDLGASWGAPVVAAADGQVVAAGWRGGYGRQVAIAHADGLVTTYSHMSSIVASPGGQVREGQLIGYVGSSGLSTGPHLHYEVRLHGRPINPLGVRFARTPQVGGEQLAAMRDRLRVLLSLPTHAG